MDRVCFTAQVEPDRLEEYRRRHERVWPEMLAALRDAGWRDYWLYLRDDGLLVGTVLADDLDALREAMASSDVNERWQAEMAPFFGGGPDDPPDAGFRQVPAVFHLESQLDAAGLSPTASDPDA